MSNIQKRQTVVPQEVIDTIETIKQNDIGKVKVIFENGDFEFHAESHDGQEKIIIKRHSIPGVVSEDKTYIQKSASLKNRMEKVLHYYKKGLTQAKIADIVMASQKTISNDIKALKNMGKLK